MPAHPTDVIPLALAIEIVGAISLARGTLATNRDLARSGTYAGAGLAVGWRIADDARTRIGLSCLAIGFVLQFAAYGIQSGTADTSPPSWWAYGVALAVAAVSPRAVAQLQTHVVGQRVRAVLNARESPSSPYASWTVLILDGAGFNPTDGEDDVEFVERITGIRMPATAEAARALDSAADAPGRP